MNHTYLFLFFFIFICSCRTEKQYDIKALQNLDKRVRKYENLLRFSNTEAYDKKINESNVCYSKISECRLGELPYTEVLQPLEIPVDEFDTIQDQVSKLGYKTYYREGRLSIWVIDGALGDIYGHLVNHDSIPMADSTIYINNKYLVGIGKKLGSNVYYFSSFL